MPACCEPVPPSMLDDNYVKHRLKSNILDVNFDNNKSYCGSKLWADLVVDHQGGKTFTAIRIDQVITGSPAEKYNHDHPAEGLVHGDNIVNLGGVKIQDLAPSITTGKTPRQIH